MIQQQDFEFLQTFWTRRAVVAYSLFALNILIFVFMAFAGGSENGATLFAFGVKDNDAINNGEIWRFVTPIFLHIGLLHLAFNSYALWIVGPQVEKLYGGPRFLLLYIFTGIAGVAASYAFHPGIPSAGASGAIFGLFGVLLVFSFRYRKTIPAFFSQALGKGILMTVAINLVIGWVIPQIDLSAHIGGLVAGGVLAFIVPFARPGESERSVYKVIQALLVLLVAVSFFEVATHYAGPGFSLQNLMGGAGRSGSGATSFVDSVNRAQRSFEDSERVLESGDLRDLPDVREELRQAKEQLSGVAPFNKEADVITGDFISILQKQYEYVQEIEHGVRAPSTFIGASPQSARYNRLKKGLEDWVEREGENYGISNRK